MYSAIHATHHADTSHTTQGRCDGTVYRPMAAYTAAKRLVFNRDLKMLKLSANLMFTGQWRQSKTKSADGVGYGVWEGACPPPADEGAEGSAVSSQWDLQGEAPAANDFSAFLA